MDKWVGLRSRSWTTDHTGLMGRKRALNNPALSSDVYSAGRPSRMIII